MKKLVLFLLGLSVVLNASVIQLDTKYSSELGNPFKKKLNENTGDVQIIKNPIQVINLKVDTNLDKNSFITKTPEFIINTNDCNRILQDFLSQDYQITEQSDTKLSCKILPSTVTVRYFKDHQSISNAISDVKVMTNIHLTMIQNGKTVIDKVLSKEMDRKVGMDGDNYNLTIRYSFDFSNESLEESVHKIIEYAIFNMLNSELKGQ